jgi:ribosomal protein L7/L12
MKLTVSYVEAQNFVGEKFNVQNEFVEIGPRPDALFSSPAPSREALTEAVKTLIQNAGRTQSGHYNKIALIKATRTILGHDLREAKDFVENNLPAGGIPF